jgi:hypothetical protein
MTDKQALREMLERTIVDWHNNRVTKVRVPEHIDRVGPDLFCNVSLMLDQLMPTIERALAEQWRQQNQEIRELRGGISALVKGRERAEARAAEQAADGPPGTYLCDTCGFIAQKFMLRAADMAVGIDLRDHHEVCPNDGTPMRRKTWKEDALDSDRVAREQMARADAAEAKVAEQESLVAWLQERTSEDAVNTAVGWYDPTRVRAYFEVLEKVAPNRQLRPIDRRLRATLERATR